MSNILVVEDDILLAQTLEDILDVYGYHVILTRSYEEAIDADFENDFDLYLLDINLPTKNGITLLKEFRDNNINKPAIFLTSHKDKEILNEAFLSGADDYIKKPFDNDELIFRIEAVLKRYKKLTENITISKNIIYDPANLTLKIDNKNEKLPTKLALLLELFIKHQDSIVTKDMIIQKLWDNESEYSDGSLRVYITKLKSLIGKDRLENRKGVGYRLKS
jgi:DNA-binding response OmpR family regulator